MKENEWNWIENEEVGFFAGTLIVLSLASVIFFIISLIALISVGPIWLMGMAGSTVIPAFFITAIVSNKRERIKSAKGKNLHSKVKKLPKELRSNIGKLTSADYNDMSEAEINNINRSIDQMTEAYNANRAAVGSPKVTAIIHSLEDAAESYRANTLAVRELE